MFEKFFGREEAERKERENSTHADSPKFAPNTKIAYKPHLIPTLQKEHQQLLDVYERASVAAHARIPKRSKKLLEQFKDLFVDHVLRENTSLYIYLQHSAQGTTSQKAIRSVKSEMEQIGREVMQFLDYGTKESTEIDDEFLQRMDKISEILHRRIKQEEGYVYPNYLTKSQPLKPQRPSTPSE